VADPELYRAALRADPHNARAQAQLDAVAQVDAMKARSRKRTLLAVGLLAMALAAAGFLTSRITTRGAGAGGASSSSGAAGSTPPLPIPSNVIALPRKDEAA